MSLSPAIDTRYRLTPRDLGRRDYVVTITNVSWQGVETLTPLLHLKEFPQKRFLLDAVQQQELITILGTYRTDAWIGQQITIAAQSDSDQLRIHIFDQPTAPSAHKPRLATAVRIPDNLGITVLLVFVLILLFLLVALLDQPGNLLP